jgi:hypothetical protein
MPSVQDLWFSGIYLAHSSRVPITQRSRDVILFTADWEGEGLRRVSRYERSPSVMSLVSLAATRYHHRPMVGNVRCSGRSVGQCPGVVLVRPSRPLVLKAPLAL